MYTVNNSKTDTQNKLKGHLPLRFSPETDGKLFSNPSNNIPKIILMIDDPVIDTPSSLGDFLPFF